MTVDLGVAVGVAAQSFGEPGQRTFRLAVLGSRGQFAALWMEKEHFSGLSVALRRLLSEAKHEGAKAEEMPTLPAAADYDFRVGGLGIGSNAADRTIILQASEEGTSPGDHPAIQVRLPEEQAAYLVEQLDKIVSAGRPICPLCGLPIDSSRHPCVRSNGHSKENVPGAGSSSADA